MMTKQERWYDQEPKNEPSASYLVPFTREVDSNCAHSIIVMRLPWQLSEEDGYPFLHEIAKHGFLPLVFSGNSHEDGADDQPWQYWPTDAFREIGNYIVINRLSSFLGVHRFLQEHDIFGTRNSKVLQSVSGRIVTQSAFFCGGDFFTVYDAGIFLYSENRMKLDPDRPDRDNFDYSMINALLEGQGWLMEPLNTQGLSFNGNIFGEDLDFLFFPFVGKDARLHAICAQLFADRVPGDFISHIISNEEAAHGGCNVADCARGKVLISPNRRDSSTLELLKRYAQAEIIEAPENYLEGGGGPRCLTSSFFI